MHRLLLSTILAKKPHFLAWTALWVVLLLAVGTPAFAQSETTSLTIDQVVVEGDGDRLTAVVSVLDNSNDPVPGLSEFRASVNDVPAQLSAIRSGVDQDVGVSVVLLIDVSASMQGEPLARARDAAVGFVQELLPTDHVAILPFGSRVPADVEFADDAGAAIRDVRALTPDVRGGTALHDAIVAGVALAEEAPTKRQAVLMLTDGQDTGDVSGVPADQVLAVATEADLPVFSIALGEDVDIEFLNKLAEASSGVVSEAPAPEDLPGVFAAISAQLRGQYLLEIEIPETLTSSSRLAIEIEGLRAEAPLSISAEPTGSSSSALLATLGGGAFIAFVGLLALWIFLRRRRRRSPVRGGPGAVGPSSGVASRSMAPLDAGEGVLEVIEGPEHGLKARVGSSPLLLGSAPGCDVRLNGGAAGQHLRVWMKDGRLVLHHLAFGHDTLVGGSPVEWATLQPGDRFQVGSDMLEFALEVPIRSGMNQEGGSFLS